jgi:hypothetical protein
LDIEDPVFVSPYPMLIYNWDLLEKEANKETEDIEEKQDLENLKALMKLVSTNSGDLKLDAYFRSRDANLKNGKITYETVWTLFPPGEMVLSRPFLGKDQLFIVQDSLRYGWPLTENSRRRKPPPWTVICWSYDWDGAYFDRKPFEFDIEPFSGTRSINSLNIYPVKFYRDPTGATWESNLKPALIERGKRFREICVAPRGSRMFDYIGLALSRGRGISAQIMPGEEPPSLSASASSVNGDYWDEYGFQQIQASKPPVTKKSQVGFNSHSREDLQILNDRRSKEPSWLILEPTTNTPLLMYRWDPWSPPSARVSADAQHAKRTIYYARRLSSITIK